MPIMRPGPDARRLLPGQISQLVIAEPGGVPAVVIYETDQLIEAPNWAPDGAGLVFNADGRLFWISPDGRLGPTRINTAPVENINNDHVIAPDGDLIYVSANDGHIYVVPLAGGLPLRVSQDVAPGRHYFYYLHGISPDGATLAYVALERRGDGSLMTRIATLPSKGGAQTYLTDGACPVDGPEFSPNGSWIYFNSEAAATRPGHAQLFRMHTDGSALKQLTHDARVNWFPHIAPDGKSLVYISFPTGTEGHPADCDVIIRAMPTAGGPARDIDRFNGGQGTMNVASWAPDSRRFAYIRYPVRP